MDLSRVDVLDMLETLQVRNLTDFGNEAQFSCPFPYHSHGDETPSAYMNTETTAFYCHGCKAKGNAIHFLAKLEGISPLLAARFLRERYGSGFSEPDGELLRELDDLWRRDGSDLDQLSGLPIINYQMEPLPEGPLDYMLGRGFLPATLESWQIGYDQLSHRIAIPVANENGSLIGFKGRAYRPEHQPKYLVLGDRENREARYGFPTYEVSRVVFGLGEVINSHLKDNTVIITEGELDVISLHQKGFTNAVSVGSNPSHYHRDLLLTFCDSVILFLDSDKAGVKGTVRLIDLLEPYVPVFVVPDHEDDPASLTAEACDILIREAVSTQEIWLPDIENTD